MCETTDAVVMPPHVLSFVTSTDGRYIAVHADLAGIDLLLEELKLLRDQLLKNDCPHTHLFSPSFGAGDDLTETKLPNCDHEAIVVYHVKIYGWTDEWAIRHGLR